MPTYRAKVREYKTNSKDIWDIIALNVYGDTRAMNAIQDANFPHRYVGFFPADIVLTVPPEVHIEHDMRAKIFQIDVSKLLPWR